MSHTPGPWTIEEPLERILWIVQTGKESYEWDPIAIISLNIKCSEDDSEIDETDIPPPQQRANAHLIAAAPDLLEACEEAVEQLWHLAKDKETNPWVKQLRAAIAKAKGESQ